MSEVCDLHEKIMQENHAAIEGKVAKSSLKWVAAIFAIPTITAILSAWAFMASADWRYGSSLQAQQNAAGIKLLDERTITLKTEMVRLQQDIAGDLGDIKRDLRQINQELMKHSKSDK